MDSTTALFRLELPQDVPFALNLTALSVHLAPLVDRRKRRGVRYPLVPLLMVALLAKLAGAARLTDLAAWAQWRAPDLAALVGLPRSTMPHYTTWSRLFGHALDPEVFTQQVRQCLVPALDPSVLPPRGSRVIAVDGKTLRGTIPAGHTQGVHLVAAYDPASGVVLAQVAVDQKTNEIGAMPTVVAQLDLRGAVVVGDAMQTQRELSRQIVDGQGDYLWFVKDNQPTLQADIQHLFTPLAALPGTADPPNDFRTARTLDKGHGRVEERVITVSSELAGYSDWPSLAQVFQLERTVSARRAGGWTTTREVRYGVTSLPAQVAPAARLLAVARAEWGIENHVHYRRDVTLREDASQLRRGDGPQVLAVLNNAVLALTHAHANLPTCQRHFAYAFDRLLAQRALTIRS